MQFLPFVTRTPSKTSLSIFSKVDQHFTQMKGEPNSVPECAPVSRRAQVTDTAWSMKPLRRLSTSKLATGQPETREAIPMTILKPCSLRGRGGLFTKTASRTCDRRATWYIRANAALQG